MNSIQSTQQRSPAVPGADHLPGAAVAAGPGRRPASCATRATARGAEAFKRLLRLAETGDSGQVRRVVGFIAATYNGAAFPLDLYELRTVDIAISSDMLACIYALRWGRADLHTLVADGDLRVQRVIAQWGLTRPNRS